jgi:hypothetical protein
MNDDVGFTHVNPETSGLWKIAWGRLFNFPKYLPSGAAVSRPRQNLAREYRCMNRFHFAQMQAQELRLIEALVEVQALRAAVAQAERRLRDPIKTNRKRRARLRPPYCSSSMNHRSDWI